MLKMSRKLHKWLMFFIGVQFVIWSVTGAYMVIFDIDYIHGDSLVINHQTPIESEQLKISLSDIYQKYRYAENIELGFLTELLVYRFSHAGEQYVINAHSGALLSPLNKTMAIKVAQHHYAYDDKVLDVELLIDNAPSELSARHLPVYRVNFDGFSNPTLYISQHTGHLVTKRHDFWRLFDWMFRFHVADYNDGEPDNTLLLVLSLLGILACLSGLIMTYFRVFKTTAIQEKI